MDIPVEHPELKNHKLVVRPSGFFAQTKVMIDDKEVKGKRGRYIFRNNEGKEITMKLKGGLDPIPTLEIEGQTVRLVEPFKWYQYVWMGLPVLLIFHGGAIGGAIGATAFFVNANIFRQDKSTLMKYGLAAAVSLSAALAWLVMVVILQLAIGLVS